MVRARIKCKQTKESSHSSNKVRYILDSRQVAELHCARCYTCCATSQDVHQCQPASSTVGFWCLQTSVVRAARSAKWTACPIGEPCYQAASLAELVPRLQQHCNTAETLCASLEIHFAVSEINYQLMFDYSCNMKPKIHTHTISRSIQVRRWSTEL